MIRRDLIETIRYDQTVARTNAPNSWLQNQASQCLSLGNSFTKSEAPREHPEALIQNQESQSRFTYRYRFTGSQVPWLMFTGPLVDVDFSLKPCAHAVSWLHATWVDLSTALVDIHLDRRLSKALSPGSLVTGGEISATTKVKHEPLVEGIGVWGFQGCVGSCWRFRTLRFHIFLGTFTFMILHVSTWKPVPPEALTRHL